MKLPLYQIDAFATAPFTGNPAAVVLLPDEDGWLPDELMQSIAMENNLAETAFVLPTDHPTEFGLRWFTPAVEVPLCGHATLASACALFTYENLQGNTVTFNTQSGTLTVQRQGDLLVMNFPSVPAKPVTDDAFIAALTQALGASPVEVHQAVKTLAVFESASQVAALEPDFAAVAQLDTFGVIATAPGNDGEATGDSSGGPDFVSRFFAPGAGVPEDPVTGAAHCTLAPYWSQRLCKLELHARQISPRGGDVYCEALGDRVQLAGHAVPYLVGKITV